MPIQVSEDSIAALPFEEPDSAASDDPYSSRALETERLVLRRPVMADAAAIAALADDPAISSNLARLPRPYRLSDATDWIARQHPRLQPGFELLVLLKSHDGPDRPIGAVGVTPEASGQGLTLGFWMGSAYLGHGYATEAAHAAVDLAFETLEIPRLEGSCRVTAFGARRVLEKSGFQWIGHGMARSQALNAMLSVDRFVLERSVWQALRAWGRTRPLSHRMS
jgi:RimJ/RimL family protein N-acetyltransferase